MSVHRKAWWAAGVVALIAASPWAVNPSPVSASAAQNGRPTGVGSPKQLIYAGSPGTHTSPNGGGVLVFDATESYRFVKRIHTWDPPAGQEPEEVRGIAASAVTGLLYVSTVTRLGAFDLVTDKLVWEGTYDGECCDRMSVSPDGHVLYVPQFKGQRLHWYVVDARSGKLIKTLETPQSKGAHNTVYGLDGSRVFLEGVSSRLMSVADAATHSVIQTVGPFGDNVRPFTVTGNNRLLYANTDNLLGFEVADVRTGKVLHHVEVTGFSTKFERSIPHGCPSHGIALSRDEKEVWLSDGINGYIHVFDNTVMPLRQVKSINTRTPLYWITFRHNETRVYPSSLYVIDATTKQIVGGLTDEKGRPVDSEKIVEISFTNGKPVSVGDQFGVGHVR